MPADSRAGRYLVEKRGREVREEKRWSGSVRTYLRTRSSRVAVLGLASLLAFGCSNYEFRYGPYGSLDSRQLIHDLKGLPAEEPPFLLEFFWIPLIYSHVTLFNRTTETDEPQFPDQGYTLRTFRGVGPLALLWTTDETRHYDAVGDTYHRRAGWGIVHRLVGNYSHRVATEQGDFYFQEYEFLFGVIKGQGDGYLNPTPQGAVDGAQGPPVQGPPVESNVQ